MNHSFVIRQALEEDVPELIQIEHLVWNDRNAPVLTTWDDPEAYIEHHSLESRLVAVKAGRICGYVGFKPPTGLKSNAHVIEIAIAVHPDFQKQNIGKLLLDAVYQWGKEHHIRKIMLRVMATNPGAIRFYQKCGFIEQGRLPQEFYIQGQYVDDIMMYRLIT